MCIRDSCEVDRFEVAQGMDTTCTQNPWAITAVLLCTAVQELFLFFRVHAVLLMANRAPAAGGDHRWVVCCKKKGTYVQRTPPPMEKKKGGKKKEVPSIELANFDWIV